MRVNANQRDEIAASVAAHAELGPRYDAAVAEGLVERIGDEIDKRIDARLGGNRSVPAPHPGPPAYQGPTMYQGQAPAPMQAAGCLVIALAVFFVSKPVFARKAL